MGILLPPARGGGGADREKDKHTYRQTDRQTDSEHVKLYSALTRGILIWNQQLQNKEFHLFPVSAQNQTDFLTIENHETSLFIFESLILFYLGCIRFNNNTIISKVLEQIYKHNTMLYYFPQFKSCREWSYSLKF